MQGKSINGFILQQLLGTGGMADVWYAENKIGKKAAVKILLSKFCADENINSRFYTEAEVMVKLNHPNIRQVYDYGNIDGRPAIVMEYLDGMDLKSKLKRGQRFTDEELKRWWNQLVSALNYTHQKGIVHRDIKPSNIFVDGDGNIKLLDFGIAKVRESISSTQTGQKLGTLMYMSPEQVKDSKSIDYRTDVYSLAVTFVNLITGKAPYDSDTSSDFEISEQIVYKPLDMSDVPMTWQKFLAPYMAKKPEERPALRPFDMNNGASDRGGQTGGEDDETILVGDSYPKQGAPSTGGSFVPDTKVSPVVTPNPSQDVNTNRSKAWIWILAILVILLGGGITYYMLDKQKKDDDMNKKLAELYNDKVKRCDMLISNIVRDKDGNEGNKHFFIQALMTLQEIEKMEQGPNFKDLGVTPVFLPKFKLFRAKLSEAEVLVNNKYQRQVQLGLEDNSYCTELRERLDLMHDILQQSEQMSAVAIVPKSSRESR